MVVILQERMCGWLQFNRFHKIGERPDKKNPNRNVFLFNDSFKLQECIDMYEQYKDIIINK
jgi:hypothetical protein